MTRDDLRAALLLVVLVPHGIAALPLAHSASRKNFQSPLARDEFARLADMTAAVGWHASAEELAELTLSVAGAQVAVRNGLLAPFRPLFRITGTGQAWGLFTYPDRFPAQLVVESRTTTGEYRVRYAALDPEFTLAAEKFAYRRVRGVYDGNSDRAGETWDPFVSWAAGEVFAADPTAYEVRVMFRRLRTFEPGESDTNRRVDGTRAARVRRRPS
jgi:hypothetical protein